MNSDILYGSKFSWNISPHGEHYVGPPVLVHLLSISKMSRKNHLHAKCAHTDIAKWIDFSVALKAKSNFIPFEFNLYSNELWRSLLDDVGIWIGRPLHRSPLMPPIPSIVIIWIFSLASSICFIAMVCLCIRAILGGAFRCIWDRGHISYFRTICSRTVCTVHLRVWYMRARQCINGIVKATVNLVICYLFTFNWYQGMKSMPLKSHNNISIPHHKPPPSFSAKFIFISLGSNNQKEKIVFSTFHPSQFNCNIKQLA